MIHHSLFPKLMTKMMTMTVMVITTMIVTMMIDPRLNGQENGKHQPTVKPSLSGPIQRDMQVLSAQGQRESHFLRRDCLVIISYLGNVPGHMTASASGQIEKGENYVG